MAKDDIVGLVVGIAVLAGATYAIYKGYLGQAVDALLNLKLPDLGGGGSTGGDTGGGGGGTDTGGGGTDTGGGGTSTGDAVKFSVAGDWGSGRNSNWQGVVAEMAKFKPNVVVVPGDLSYAGGAAKFKPVTDAIKKFGAKVFGAMGNHDGSGDAANFDAFSNSVQNVGNTSFMLLDTENGSGSVTFAKANFAKMTGKWKVVVFHKPIKTMKSDHAADEGKLGALVPEFEKAKINIVIGAHNHNYQRFAPVGNVTYFVCGTGGESHYSLSGGGAVKSDAKNFGTTNFTTSATDIKGQFVGVGGAVIDSFTITATAATALAQTYMTNTRAKRLHW